MLMGFDAPRRPSRHTDEPPWKTGLVALWNKEQQCPYPPPPEKKWNCNVFAGEGLSVVYGVSDFKRESGWMNSTMIADTLAKGHPMWQSIGLASDPAATALAVQAAKEARGVVAVAPGHVALILPRDSVYSPSLGRYVPCVAQFSQGSQAASWIGRPLSQSWKKDQLGSVTLYARQDSPRANFELGSCDDWTPSE
jgi:hypothetical protein